MQDQAAALHAMGMMGYRELKGRLMSTTAFLVASGSLIAFSAGGSDAAYPFAVGGSAALGYQWLLQQTVDSIPSKAPRRALVKVCAMSTHTGISALQSVSQQIPRRILVEGVSLVDTFWCFCTGPGTKWLCTGKSAAEMADFHSTARARSC